MKRIQAIFMSFVLALTISIGSGAFAEQNITVILDGEAIAFDVQPQIINGRTMVPMRAIFESLGATVEWDGETQTIVSVKEDKTVTLVVGVPSIAINTYSPKELDTAPCVL